MTAVHTSLSIKSDESKRVVEQITGGKLLAYVQAGSSNDGSNAVYRIKVSRNNDILLDYKGAHNRNG